MIKFPSYNEIYFLNGWSHRGNWGKCNKSPASGTTKKTKHETKFIGKCPVCGHDIYYMGVTPSSIECSNPFCKWYKRQDIDNDERKNKYGYYDYIPLY